LFYEWIGLEFGTFEVFFFLWSLRVIESAPPFTFIVNQLVLLGKASSHPEAVVI
jgi:hypothetical protein